MPVPPMATVAISVAIVMSPMVMVVMMVVVMVVMVVMMVVMVVMASMVTVGYRRRWKSERSGNCNSKRKFS